MNKQEAKDYIKWHKEKIAEYLYLAHFSSSRPFIIDYPDSYDKLIEAQKTLGIFQWQRPYKDIQRIYPNITLEEYNEYRKKYNLDLVEPE